MSLKVTNRHRVGLVDLSYGIFNSSMPLERRAPYYCAPRARSEALHWRRAPGAQRFDDTYRRELPHPLRRDTNRRQLWPHVFYNGEIVEAYKGHIRGHSHPMFLAFVQRADGLNVVRAEHSRWRFGQPQKIPHCVATAVELEI